MKPTIAIGLLYALFALGCSRDPGAASPGDAAPGNSQPDAGGCPAEPSNLGPCTRWQCGPVPANEGAECDAVPAGVCHEGVCVAVPDPAAVGSMAWDALSYTISADGAQIPVEVFSPRAPGPHPAVIFTHGFMLDPAQYRSYGEHLASWGYVVAMPQLPGDFLSPSTHRELADLLVAVLDWTSTGPLSSRVDAAKIALAGHSMGGKLSMLVATEDLRPGAVFGVDPVDAAGGPGASDPTDYPSVTPELMSRITVPLVLLGETVNASSGGFGQACAPADENFQQYYAHAQAPALEIEVVGANHMSFLDDPSCGLTCSACPAGTDDPSHTRRLTRGYMTAFFERTLRGDERYAVYLLGRPMQAQVAAGWVLVDSKNGF